MGWIELLSMDTKQTLCRFGTLLTSLEASRSAATFDARGDAYIVSRCDSVLRVVERMLSRFARSTSGDGTICELTEDELAQMERSAARLADRDAWAFMTGPGELDSLLS